MRFFRLLTQLRRVLGAPAHHAGQQRHHIRIIRRLRRDCHERARLLKVFILRPCCQGFFVSFDLLMVPLALARA